MVGVEVPVALLPAHQRGVEHRQQRRPRLDGAARARGRRAAASRCRRTPAPPRRPRGRRARGVRRPWSRPATTPRRSRCRARRSAASGATSAAYPSSAGSGDRLLPQPVGHRRPHRARDAPVPAVATAHQVGGEAEVGEQARVVPQRAGRDGHGRGELGEQSAQVACRDPVGVLLEVGEHAGAGARRARRRRRGRCPAFSTSLAIRRRSMPATRADALPQAAGQQVAREDEQGAPHGQLLDQRAVVVQRPVDVGAGDPVDAGVQREVGRRRLGGVQDGHGAGGRDRVGHPVLRGDAVAARHPGATLHVGDQADRLAHVVARPLTSRCCRGRPGSGPRRTAAGRPTRRRATSGCAAAGRRRRGPAGRSTGRSAGGCRCTGRWSRRP